MNLMRSKEVQPGLIYNVDESNILEHWLKGQHAGQHHWVLDF